MSLAPCRSQSNAAGEGLAGTAPHAAHWLLIEHAGGWGRQALEDSDIPHAAQKALQHYIDAVPHGRIGLIKKTRRAPGTTVFAVSCEPPHPSIFRYSFDSWDGLLGLDGPALFSGHAPLASRWLEPLFLVCTHGKRDRCCAEAGLPLYQALQDEWGTEVWETSHIGGHRFAPNLVCLPHGLVYGRCAPEDGPRLAREYAKGLIDVEHFRGRSAWPAAVQAAEILYRQDRSDPHLESLTLQCADTEGPTTHVTFATHGQPLLITVRATVSLHAAGFVRRRAAGDSHPVPENSVTHKESTHGRIQTGDN